MDLIAVDYKKCVKCGLCAHDCVMGVLEMSGPGQTPRQVRETCIACGHCVAICPTAAMDNVRAPLAGQIPLKSAPSVSPEDAERFLRMRRSVRLFDDRPVPRGLITRMLDVSRYAPTAVNSQGISFYVIDERRRLKRIADAMIAWEEAMLPEAAETGEQIQFMRSLIARYRQKGEDVMLWRAPCLIIALADRSKVARSPRDNALFYLTYANLFAQSLGLGCCWAGIFEACWRAGFKELRDLIELPEDREMAGALMVGYSKHKYYRLVARDPLEVTWDS